MANSVSNIDQIAVSQSAKEATANSFFNAASNAALWALHVSDSGGLVWGFYGGQWRYNGALVQVANNRITLGPNVTTFIEANSQTGEVTQNLLGFTAGRIPLYTVITGPSTVTSYTDHRANPIPDDGLASITVTGSAQLSNAQAACRVIELSGSPSAGFTLTFPARTREFTLSNGTGQAATISAGGGATIDIAAGKVAKFYTAATKVVRITPDA